MLRAVFFPDGQQCVLERVHPYAFTIRDLRDSEPPAQQAALESIRREMSHQGLDPERWPLFDIRLTLLDGGRTRLHVSIDLLIADAASLLLLFREWSLLYAQPDAPLPALDLTFRDCMLAEVALRQTEAYARPAYWWDRLATLPPGPELPLAGETTGDGPPRFVRREGASIPSAWRTLKDRAAERGSPRRRCCAPFMRRCWPPGASTLASP